MRFLILLLLLTIATLRGQEKFMESDDEDQRLRAQVESSRKRKYLKSNSVNVPKRTVRYWEWQATKPVGLLEGQEAQPLIQQDLHGNISAGCSATEESLDCAHYQTTNCGDITPGCSVAAQTSDHSVQETSFQLDVHEDISPDCSAAGKLPGHSGQQTYQRDLLRNISPCSAAGQSSEDDALQQTSCFQQVNTRRKTTPVAGNGSSPDRSSSSSSNASSRSASFSVSENDSNIEESGDEATACFRRNRRATISCNSSSSGSSPISYLRYCTSSEEDSGDEERQEQADRSQYEEEQHQEESELSQDDEANDVTDQREEGMEERENDSDIYSECNRDHGRNNHADDNEDREGDQRQEEENEENGGDIENGEDGGNEENENNDDNIENGEDGGHEENENNAPQNQRRNNNFRKLQDYIEFPPNSEAVQTPVNVSRIDMLYMALGLARQNNDTNKALNDAVKLLNTLFTSPVLPRSSFLLDKLVMSFAGVRYFFFCGQCFHSFGELDYENIKEELCPTCGEVNPISDLRIASYFCLFDLKRELEALLTDETVRQSLCTPSEAVARSQNGFFTDIYSGSMYKKFAETLGNQAEHVVSFQLNTDGSPVFQSSKCSIWPISLAVNELSPDLRMKNILIAGLWFGKNKPPMNLFLEPFVNQMCTLSEPFNIKVADEEWSMRAYVIGVSVDSGARGAVQGLKTHSGYGSCSWCFIHGEYLARAVRFPLTLLVPKNRCHDDIIKLQYDVVNEGPQPEPESESDISDSESSTLSSHGVNAVSPLINLPGFDMVQGFFVEGMHLLHLGITKNAIRKWCKDDGEEYYIKGFQDEINRRIKSLRPPEDCRRMPRALDEKPRYKARELENFLLFCIVPLLTGILPDKYIRMWLLFSQAVYMLSLTKIKEEYVNIADVLLKKFMVQWQEAYGNASMTFNIHLLYHLAEHVGRWGNLWASSAYCFEAFNGLLKKVIRSQQGIPNQVIRSLSWQQAMKILEPHVSRKAKEFVRISIAASKTVLQRGLRVGDHSVLLGKPKPYSPSNEELYLWQNEGIETNFDSVEVYKRVVHKKTVYAPDLKRRKTNNSLAQLNDKTLVLIRKIMFDRIHSQIFLLVSSVHYETLLEVPEVSLEPSEHLMNLITHVEPNSRLINCEDLSIICFRATFPHGDFVARLPNVMNRS